MATLFAIGDLHANHPQNRRFVDQLTAHSAEDWLVVCGDVADSIEDVESVLGSLSGRFAKTLWAPGNHELLSPPGEPRGESRYRRLVEACRGQGVLTPEDPYPLWEGPGGPALVAPLFLLYDYTFGVAAKLGKAEALRRAYLAGIVCVDEFLLDPQPHASREAWCQARIATTEARLQERPAGIPTVLVNHFPLLEGPTRLLRHLEFAAWCGTTRTADWHLRFEATVVVYGHLHIPITSWYDGVRFEEVSLGYPREWTGRSWSKPGLRPILGEAAA